MLTIRPTDRVLEIGSGNRPRRRSDVLCDRYPWDNTERSGGDTIAMDRRPFVVADAAHLPFKNHSFDYVIASHVLEHVQDPLRVAAELMRVARAGYIETPSELSERLFGWSFHKWMVHREGDVLVFRPPFVDSVFGEYFHRLSASDRMFAEIVDQHFDDFYVRYEWHEHILLRMEHTASGEVRWNTGPASPETLPPSRVRALRGLKWILQQVLRMSRRLRRFYA
jgi:SAM-dependent methyltransferase